MAMPGRYLLSVTEPLPKLGAVSVARTGTEPVLRNEVPEWADAIMLAAKVPSSSKPLSPVKASVRVASVSPLEMLPTLAMERFCTVVASRKSESVTPLV